MIRRHVGRVLGPALAVVGVWLVLGWWPSRSTLHEAHGRMEIANQGADSLRVELDDLRMLPALEPQVLTDTRLAASAIPAEANLGAFLRDVDVVGSTAGATVISLTPMDVFGSSTALSGRRTPEGVAAVSFRLVVNASYEDLLSFLAELDDMDRLILLDDITMTIGALPEDPITMIAEFRVFTTEILTQDQLPQADIDPLAFDGSSSETGAEFDG